MALPDCQTIIQEFSQESGRIAPRILQTRFYESPWMSLVKMEPWENERGYTQVAQTRERSIPASLTDWAAITSANSCDPPTDTIYPAWTNLNFTRYQKAFESPEICINELMASHDPAAQVAAYVQDLEDNTLRAWHLQKRDWYLYNSGHKIVFNQAAGYPESAAGSLSFPNTVATSRISIGFLQRYLMQMWRDGAQTNGGAMGFTAGAPIFPVILSPEAIDSLLKDNEDIRQDIRWSDEVKQLIGPLGGEKSYGNFHFIADIMPPRYNFESGQYVRVPEYVNVATTYGNSAEVNPAYENAQFEVGFFFNPNVYRQQNPTAMTKVGKLTYGPQNYMGDFRFESGYDRQCNVDRNKGFFRAVLSAAARPYFPRYGYAFMYLRCDRPIDTGSCAPYSGYNA